jgi:hypothetical protein
VPGVGVEPITPLNPRKLLIPRPHKTAEPLNQPNRDTPQVHWRPTDDDSDILASKMRQPGGARFLIVSEFPTIQELAGSAERSNSVECGRWNTQCPANAPDPRRVEASAVSCSLRKAGCGSQLCRDPSEASHGHRPLHIRLLYLLFRATSLRMSMHRTRVRASPLGRFHRVRGAFSEGYRRKHMVCVRDFAFRCMSTIYVR